MNRKLRRAYGKFREKFDAPALRLIEQLERKLKETEDPKEQRRIKIHINTYLFSIKREPKYDTRQNRA